MVREIKVLISHAHNEKALAKAWHELIENLTLGIVKTWFSSDTSPDGGINIGKEWRDDLYNKLSQSDFIIAIQTPSSSGRPWIMWECGVASGINKERGIIPIIYSIERSDLANPLSSYQVYKGDDEMQVREVCERIVKQAEINRNELLLDTSVKTYFKSVELYGSQKSLFVEEIEIWRERFEKLIREGRAGEIIGIRETMYASFGKLFKPSEQTLVIHELLSQILLEQKHSEKALEETNYALSLLNKDTILLHRKALILVELHNLQEAEALIKRIISIDQDLRSNSEIASLEGRLFREKWSSTKDTQDLEAAIEAYHRAYEADKTQYYPGINAASLALAKGDQPLAEQIFQEVLETCEQLQQRQVVSYWVDFTAGEAYLGLGQVEKAIEEYRKGLTRNPFPSERERNSALKGASRIIEVKNISKDIYAQIKALLA